MRIKSGISSTEAGKTEERTTEERTTVRNKAFRASGDAKLVSL